MYIYIYIYIYIYNIKNIIFYVHLSPSFPTWFLLSVSFALCAS